MSKKYLYILKTNKNQSILSWLSGLEGFLTDFSLILGTKLRVK